MVMTRAERRRQEKVRLRALTRLSLRRSGDPDSPLYQEWHVWGKGQIFEPPPHMNVERALARGIIERVGDAEATEEEVSAGD